MKFVRLKILYEIHWLKQLLNHTSALVVNFHEAVGDPTSCGLLKHFKSFKFLLAIHYLLDMLGYLRQLNKTFQITAFHLYDAQKSY